MDPGFCASCFDIYIYIGAYPSFCIDSPTTISMKVVDQTIRESSRSLKWLLVLENSRSSNAHVLYMTPSDGSNNPLGLVLLSIMKRNDEQYRTFEKGVYHITREVLIGTGQYRFIEDRTWPERTLCQCIC